MDDRKARHICSLKNRNTMAKHSILIVGAGGIGRAAGLLLAELADFDADIWIGDISQTAIDEAIAYIGRGTGVLMQKGGPDAALAAACESCEVLLDCAPGKLAPKMAGLAVQHNMHYANLTEYVQETEEIKALAANAKTGFILQTGLAPGFVGVLAIRLYEEFQENFGGDGQMEYISMKVGALTQSANAPHYYGFTWSPIGVATEYVKDAITIRDFKQAVLPSLSEYERLIIDGVTYEADLTSGGAADLPEAFSGKVRKLDYKTIRWPGHYPWVHAQLKKVASGEDQANALEAEMLRQIPVEEDDIVIIQAYVIGKDGKGQLRQHGRNYHISPIEVGGKTLRAIQSTTAAALVECARMLLTGKYKGIVLQSQLNAKDFLNGPFIQHVYKN